MKPTLRAHVLIVIAMNGYEGFFDRLGRGPAQCVVRTTSFVVRTGHSAATEWLLAHNGTRRFIVYVKIARRIFELFQGDLRPIAVTKNTSS